MPFYTYILCCRDGSFYTGWTDNLQKRVFAHNEGRGGNYTRSHRPVRLVYFEEFPSKSTAMSREYAIKKMCRNDKETLIRAADKKMI